MTRTNRQWRLASYPEGRPDVDNWTLSEGAVPEPANGEMLVRGLYLDVAPYMRGRISPQKNYAGGVGIGEVMVGGAVGEVVESRCAGYEAGDVVVTDFGFGWQEYSVLTPAAVRPVDPSVTPLPVWLDVLGLNGVTAWFALLEAGGMKPGDTVVVSAASGSVGQIAGQIARRCGCRAVAISSSPAKLQWCREIGYHETIDYRAEADLAAAVARACPDGVDLFLDNTAGPVHDAVLQNLALRARVVVVGTVALADRFGQPDVGPRYLRQLLVARARVQGFLVMDYQHRYEEARSRLLSWYRAGELRTRFDIAEGLESMPAAFLRVMTGDKLGKQVVRVAAAAPS